MPAAVPLKPETDITHRIYAARALRDFGDGFVAVLLPVYLSVIGLDAFGIGLAATLALLGSATMTLAIGLWGARYSQRTLLVLAALLMCATGVGFAVSSTAGLILLVAFFGTINPSAGSVSIFVPLEHALLSGAVRDADRTRMFARYSLIGAMAAAVGALGAGSPELLQAFGLAKLTALQLMFVLYAVLGLLGGALYAGLPTAGGAAGPSKSHTLGPSKRMVYTLAGLFSIDSFAGGFAVQSIMALWLLNRFGLSVATTGAIFFWTSLLAAGSQLVAPRPSSRRTRYFPILSGGLSYIESQVVLTRNTLRALASVLRPILRKLEVLKAPTDPTPAGRRGLFGGGQLRNGTAIPRLTAGRASMRCR